MPKDDKAIDKQAEKQADKQIEKLVAEKNFKFEKIEKIEHKEKPEKFEKHEKFEHKDKFEKFEHKDKFEKFEKIEKIEFETISQPEQIPDPVLQGTIEERVARLEQVLSQLSHFIGADLRPDLSRGALKQEPAPGGKTPGSGSKR